MAYLITAKDHSGMDDKRERVREAHRAYLASHGRKLLASGALLNEAGQIVGGASLLDTDDYEEAVRFEKDDPYAKEGIRSIVKVEKWRLRWWVGQFDSESHHPGR